jgi:hypothetical protein
MSIFYRMENRLQPLETSSSIFERLEAKGIQDYGAIKSIVSFQSPQSAVFFVEQFDRRTLTQVLQQIERWKEFLKTDFIMSSSQRAEITKKIVIAQRLVGNAPIEANSPRVGDWEMEYSWITLGQDESGKPIGIRPALRIRARHCKTDEIRDASIPHELTDAASLGPNPFRKAFEELGLWGELKMGSLRRYLVSARKPQGWPMYTKIIIPQLYEFLIPYYPNPAHHSEKRDTTPEKRMALFPTELLRDMLEILQIEHPHVFGKATVNQLKASVRRHLDRKAGGTKSPA